MKLSRTTVHWAEICTYPAYGRIDPHSHDFFHYIYVIAGVGEITIDDRLYSLTPKHMYLVRPEKIHTFRNSREERLVTMEIKFDCQDGDLGEKLLELPQEVDTTGTPVLSILHNIRRENGRCQGYYRSIISLNLQEIFLHLLRLSGQQHPNAQNGMEKVLEYIESNLHCDINLQDLSNIVCLERTYFLKKFKQLTGVTPMAYTRNARIRRAKELLTYSDMNVTQIAEAVGFRSIHYFTRQFTDLEGVSPGQYKRLHQPNSRNP